jgi:hypothetical protein
VGQGVYYCLSLAPSLAAANNDSASAPMSFPRSRAKELR